MSGVTCDASVGSGSDPRRTCNGVRNEYNASTCSSEGAARNASMFAGDTGLVRSPAFVLSLQIMTSESGALYGSGWSRTPRTMANIALFAPIPRASEATVRTANIGDRQYWRNASRRSFRIESNVKVLLLREGVPSKCRACRPKLD